MSPEETAAKILTGTLGGHDMPFSKFRQAMFDRHPDYLTDKEMHDVWMIVRNRLFLADEVTTPDMEQAIQRHEAAVDQAMDWLDVQEVSPLKERPVDKEGYHPKEDPALRLMNDQVMNSRPRFTGQMMGASNNESFMTRTRRKMMGFLPRT